MYDYLQGSKMDKIKNTKSVYYYDGYKYYRDSRDNGIYRCVQKRNYCYATIIITEAGEIIRNECSHKCPPNYDVLEAIDLTQQLLHKAETSDEKLVTIFQNEIDR